MENGKHYFGLERPVSAGIDLWDLDTFFLGILRLGFGILKLYSILFTHRTCHTCSPSTSMDNSISPDVMGRIKEVTCTIPQKLKLTEGTPSPLV